jgi:hypothetical protein
MLKRQRTATPNGRVRAHSAQTPTIRCTLSDMLVRDMPTPVIFFYDWRLDPDAIAHGLGQVLGDFSIFNARVIKRGADMFLDCNDNGVTFSVCKRDSDLRDAMAELNTPACVALVDMIDSKRALAHAEPVLTVRISHFADGGSSLGICWHHSVGDMQTFMQLMQAWSNAVAKLPYAKPLVVEDRVAYFNDIVPGGNRAGSGLRYLSAREIAGLAFYMLTKARDRALVSFCFGTEELAALRESLQRQSDERLSTNDALCAHMFALIAGYDSQARARNFGVVVNFRKRIGLPAHLLGNLLTAVNTWSEPNKPASRVASDLRRGLDRCADEHLDYCANNAFAAAHGGCANVSRFLMKAVDPKHGSLLVSNWKNFGVFGITFGGAPPRFFSPAAEVPFPWLSSVLDGFDDRGAIFSAALPTQIVARLSAPDGLRQVHRHRTAADSVPEIGRGLPWVL